MLLIPRSGVLALLVCTTVVATAEPPTPNPSTENSLSPAVIAPGPVKVHLIEGTEVPLLFVDSLSSATNAQGDRFTLRVDGDVRIGDQIAINAGAIAVGVVTNAHKRGFMGKAGELNVTLDHVTVGDDRIRLRANKSSEGQSKVGTTVALTVLFGPIGLLKRGHDIDIKPGTPIMAFVDQTTDVTVQH